MTGGQKLKKARLGLKISQRRLAALVGIASSLVSEYEKGDRKPSFKTLYKLISFFNEKGISLTLEDLRPENEE